VALSNHQKAVHRVFENLKARNVLLPSGVERQFVTDDRNGHYQLLNIGWEGQRHVHSILVQIDIKGDFVWVQADNTEYNIVDALLAEGVPQNRIVLGFQAPYKRAFTEFATGDEIAV
jgi:hypothetical protein